MTAPGQHETTVAAPADDALQLAAPGWAFVMYQNLISGLGEIVAKVTIEDTELNSLVASSESLSSAVEAFLANNPAVPPAQLEPLQQALKDSQQAQTDLANAVPTPTPTPAPDPTPGPAPEPAAGP